MFDFPPNVYTYIGLCAVVASATFVVALLIHNWIKLKRAIRESESYQSEVHRWALECFGRECVMDTAERNMRFAEEAMELVQACGMPRRAAHAMVDWVYERPCRNSIRRGRGSDDYADGTVHSARRRPRPSSLRRVEESVEAEGQDHRCSEE